MYLMCLWVNWKNNWWVRVFATWVSTRVLVVNNTLRKLNNPPPGAYAMSSGSVHINIILMTLGWSFSWISANLLSLFMLLGASIIPPKYLEFNKAPSTTSFQCLSMYLAILLKKQKLLPIHFMPGNVWVDSAMRYLHEASSLWSRSSSWPSTRHST